MDNQGSNNDREFLGITQNDCTFQGKVIGDPIIQNDNYAFMRIKTSIREMGTNGQWNDVIIEIPVMTTDPKKVASIQKYVKDGKTLLLNTNYKAWVNQGQQQHAFMIRNMEFGSNKWDPNKQDIQTPALPVQ